MGKHRVISERFTLKGKSIKNKNFATALVTFGSAPTKSFAPISCFAAGLRFRMQIAIHLSQAVLYADHFCLSLVLKTLWGCH